MNLNLYNVLNKILWFTWYLFFKEEGEFNSSVFGSFWVFSCQNSKESGSRTVTLQDQYLEAFDTSLFGNYCVIPLELQEESLIKTIDKVILFDNKIGIVDLASYSFLIFDKEGHFINKIHSVGNGPEEYIQLIDVSLDVYHSNLLFLASPKSLLIYDFKGNFLEKKPLEELYTEMVVTKEYIYFLSSDLINDDLQEYALTVLDRRNDQLKKIMPHGVRPAKNLITRGRVLSSGEDASYFVQRFTNRIYKIEGPEVTHLTTLNVGSFNLPDNMLVDDYDQESFLDFVREKRYVFSLTNFTGIDNGFLLCSNRPGFFHFDSNKEKLVHYDVITNQDYGIDFSYFTPLESSDKKIAFVLEDHKVSLLKEHRRDHETAALKELLDALPEESNPVLFLYDLKR